MEAPITQWEAIVATSERQLFRHNYNIVRARDQHPGRGQVGHVACIEATMQSVTFDVYRTWANSWPVRVVAEYEPDGSIDYDLVITKALLLMQETPQDDTYMLVADYSSSIKLVDCKVVSSGQSGVRIYGQSATKPKRPRK